MAVCLIMQFAGIDHRKYEAVLEKLSLRSANASWPKGIVSHVAGATTDGLCVVDVWNSQQEFDEFMKNRLKPALDSVGGVPQPRVTAFEVHNSYRTDT